MNKLSKYLNPILDWSLLILCLVLLCSNVQAQDCCDYAKQEIKLLGDNWKMAVVKITGHKEFHALYHNDKSFCDNGTLFQRCVSKETIIDMVRRNELEIYEWSYPHCQFFNGVKPMSVAEIRLYE